MDSCSICEYCHRVYNNTFKPYSLSCNCVMCYPCIMFLQNNRVLSCPIRNHATRPNNPNEYTKFTENIKNEKRYKDKETEKSNVIKAINSKISLLDDIIKEKQRSIASIRKIETFYELASKIRYSKMEADKLGLDAKLDYVKKLGLFQFNNIPNMPDFISKHMSFFSKAMYSSLLQTMKLEVFDSSSVEWTGGELMCREYTKSTSIIIKLLTGNQIKLIGLGILLGNKEEDEGIIESIVISEKKLELVKLKLDNGTGFITDVSFKELDLVGGVDYKLDINYKKSGKFVLMKNSKSLINDYYQIDLQCGTEAIHLAYLRISK